MLSNILHSLAAVPVWAKTLLVSAAPVVLGPSALLTSLLMTLAFLTVIVAGSGGERHA